MDTIREPLSSRWILDEWGFCL